LDYEKNEGLQVKSMTKRNNPTRLQKIMLKIFKYGYRTGFAN
jgi:hypothetical protein